MVRGNAENLKRAAQAKQEAAVAKAEKGLRKLLKARAPITFQTVAAESGVSKDFLYRTTELRERIMDLREGTALQPKPKQTPLRAEPFQGDTSSIVRTLTAKLTEERSTNRKRISELEAALAVAQGQILQLRRLAPNATHPDKPASAPTRELRDGADREVL